MTNEEKSAAIEAYLSGTLAPEQIRAFEDRLASDPALRKELALHRELPAALGDRAFNRFRDNLTSVVAENRASERRFPRGMYWTAAALFLLSCLVAVFWLYRARTTLAEQLFAAHFTPPATLLVPGAMRNGSASAEFPLIEQLYQQKNYPAALAGMERMAAQPGFTESSTFHYQMTVLALAAGDGQLALRHVDRIEFGYFYEKQWYRALALLLARSEPAATRAALLEIARSDSPFRTDAAQLLQEMPK